MRRMKIERSEAEITSHAGLALIGRALQGLTDLAQEAKAVSPLRADAISHADVLRSTIGPLCLGKSDFQAVNSMRGNWFFVEALGLKDVPSEATLRQRLDDQAVDFLPVVQRASIEFLRRSRAPITPLANGLVPCDIDVSPFDNSDTHKEGVSRTYKGTNGFAPIAAYLGREGWCLEWELREGRQHCQKGTPAFLNRVLASAVSLTPLPVLARMDSGNDAIETLATIVDFNEAHPEAAPVRYVVKWNPRQTDPEYWLTYAEQRGDWQTPRPGKRVALFEVRETRAYQGYLYDLRRVMRVTERRINRHGQSLLIPDIEIEGWWHNLWYTPQAIIDLYADHGTSEQFHSEFKTDLDLERFPSGKFATNALILACGQLAYNLLRYLGQEALLGPDAPIRHPAKRRRIRTVMQELMYLAARLISSGRQLILAFGSGCPVVPIFRRLYLRLA